MPVNGPQNPCVFTYEAIRTYPRNNAIRARESLETVRPRLQSFVTSLADRRKRLPTPTPGSYDVLVTCSPAVRSHPSVPPTGRSRWLCDLFQSILVGVITPSRSPGSLPPLFGSRA